MTLAIALLITTAAYVGYEAWGGWQPASPPVPNAVLAPAAPKVVAKRTAQGRITPAAARPNEFTHVTKCVVDGATSYSDAGCPSNARSSILTLDTRDNLATGLPVDFRQQVLAMPARD